MPRLGLDASTTDKRKQIADMKFRGIITFNPNGIRVNDNLVINNSNVFEWSELEVFKYYNEVITDENINTYDAVVEVERQEETGDNAVAQTRPTAQSYDLVNKSMDIRKSQYSDEEKAVMYKELEDDLLYQQLKYDKEHGDLNATDQIDIYNQLEQKFAVKTYAKQSLIIDHAKGEIEKLDSQLKTYTKVPQKPSRLTQMWNKVRLVFVEGDLPSITKYNDYKKLSDQRARLERRIVHAETLQKLIKQDHIIFDYYKDAKPAEKENTKLDLAKNIVIKTINANAKGKASSAAKFSAGEIADQAKVVMESTEFKNLYDELGDEAKHISPDVFYGEFMKKMITYSAFNLKKQDEEVTREIVNSTNAETARMSNENEARGIHL